MATAQARGAGPGSAGLDEQAAGRLVAQLADTDFQVRDAAQKQLIEMGEPVRPYLENVLKTGKMEAEQTQRIGAIFKALDLNLVRAHPKGSTTPANIGISVELVAKATTYRLDKAQQGEAFRAALEEANGGGPGIPGVGGALGGRGRRGGRGGGGGMPGAGARPEPPAVDLALALTNTTDKPLSIDLGGDEGTLTLQGPGAAKYEPANMMMTMEYRAGTPLAIAPGQTALIPIHSLQYGQREMMGAYWTEPGEYQLSASYTAVTTSDAGGQQQQITFKADPIKLRVLGPDETAAATIKGTIQTKDHADLGGGANVIVQVQDISAADAPAKVIGSLTIMDVRDFPIPFEVNYDAKATGEKGHRFALSVRHQVQQGRKASLYQRPGDSRAG